MPKKLKKKEIANRFEGFFIVLPYDNLVAFWRGTYARQQLMWWCKRATYPAIRYVPTILLCIVLL